MDRAVRRIRIVVGQLRSIGAWLDLAQPIDLFVQRIENGAELHLGHLGEHPDVLDLRRHPRVLATEVLASRGRKGCPEIAARVAITRWCVRAATSCRARTASFLDQGIGELLGLVEKQDGLVGDGSAD